MHFKIGSLFDGSGGFPLAAYMCGGIPMWASEVEPYPIAVTKSCFPAMKHLGDISKINGATIEPVDVITFGSPCQDLSIAGKRAGLKHEANGDEETTRSGLFMEAVRIIKEMRAATNGKYPTFALWENVPGAFSSNKGDDFRIVLEELIKVAEPQVPEVPAPGKAGWPYADCIMGDGWSVAWRVFDAQYWGVPQRRRRIHLVADFAGDRAAKVLFEREGLRGNFETGRTPGQGIARNPAHRSAGYDRMVEDAGFNGYKSVSGSIQFEKGTAATIEANMPGNVLCCLQGNMIDRMDRHSVCCAADMYNGTISGDVTVTLTTATGQGASNTGPSVLCAAFSSGQGVKANGIGWAEEMAPTLRAADCGSNRAPTVLCRAHGQANAETLEECSPTLSCNHEQPIVFENHSQDARYTRQKDTCPTCVARWGTGGNNMPLVAFAKNQRDEVRDLNDLAGALMAEISMKQQTFAAVRKLRWIVRRLTPTECARLQGFADEWGHPVQKTDFTDEEYRFWLEVRNTHAAINGKTVKAYTKEQLLKWYNGLHTDSSEYKMWGNGIALPPALYVMQGISEVLNNGTKK